MRNPFKKDPDPFAASRFQGMVKGVRTRQRKHMRHWWQWAILGLALLVFGFAAFGIWKYYDTQRKIQIDVEFADPEEEGKPFNALLVGSDSREGLTEQEQFELGAGAVGGARADTLIVAHVDPANDRVIMVQFPRDLWVPVNGGSENKINAALLEGRGALVKTVEDFTGLQINRYVQVNIAGFRDLVDAIGGVSICITEPIPFDPQVGLEITEDELGMIHFDGDRALRFVRSRHFPTGDFQRIQNQQKFLSAAVNKITSVGTLLRPDKILKLLDVAGDNLRANMNIPQIKSLLDRFRAFDPEHYEAYTSPNFGVGAAGELSIVVPDPETAKIMFEAIKRNESPAEADGVPSIAPPTVRVGVYNGSFVAGAAAAAATALDDATNTGAGGVDVVDVADWKRFDFKRTVVRYEPNARRMAELVAAAIPGSELARGSTPEGVDVAVIVGERFTTKKIVQILPIPLPPPGDPPPECT